MKKTQWVALALLIQLLAGWDFLRGEHDGVARGTEHYRRGDYKAAAQAYEAAIGSGDAARVHFDLGTALFKLSETEPDLETRSQLLGRAEAEFRLAVHASDAGLSSAAYYNLGNTLFRRERYREAMSAYRRSLLAEPSRDDARHNFEIAYRRAQTTAGDNQQGEPAAARGVDPRSAGDEASGADGTSSSDADSGVSGANEASAPGSPGPGTSAETSAPASSSSESGNAAGSRGRDSKTARLKTRASDVSESTRKLSGLQRRSRQLRRLNLRKGGHSLGDKRVAPEKDW